MGAVIDRAGFKQLPIGSEDFERVVSERVYVDKTALVRDIIDSAYSVTLFCRPRRFGKSLAMRMLQCFFEAPVEWGMRSIPDRSGLFAGTDVAASGERFMREQGSCPVVFLNLGSAGGATWEEAREQLALAMASEFSRHGYLLEGGALDRSERAFFERVLDGVAEDAELAASLARLSEWLQRWHGAGTVIIIDEYDHPVTSGHLRGYRDQAVDFMRNWLTGALKATTSLRLACLTGVQRVSKESIFSGLNNIVVNTSMDGEFTEGFGFTADEAQALAAYAGLPQDRLPEMHDWYDGYCFGGMDVYNPWSVLNYLKKGGAAQPYWGNTSDNAIVHELFAQAGGTTADELRELAAGRRVLEPVELATVFSDLDSPEARDGSAAFWGQLYLAGYVTTEDVALPNDDISPRELRVPNREVGWLFRREFASRVNGAVRDQRALRELRRALVEGDAERLEASLGRVLVESPSYLDLISENSYHMFMLGLLYEVPGYRFPRSNRESGDGRPDIALEPELENQGRLPAIVIEVKHGDGAPLEEQAAGALAQIEERRYGADMAGSGLLAWGVAFKGKNVACTCERP